MTNAPGKIRRLMTYRCEERFMVYDKNMNLGVIIQPGQEAFFPIEAFGGEEIQRQGLREDIPYDSYGPHTDLLWFLCMPIIDKKVADGDDIPPLLYPEACIEYAYVLWAQKKIDEITFARMRGLSGGLRRARDCELDVPEGKNPIIYYRELLI